MRALAFVALVVFATPAAAQDAEWQLGLSAFGVVNGSFLTEPATEDKVIEHEGRRAAVLYPGFGGFGGGGGFSITASWRGLLSLEFGPYWSVDQGEGSLQINNFDLDFTVGQVSTHLPIILKVAAPTRYVRPIVFGGPEIVIPGEAELIDSSVPISSIDAEADTYLAWAFGIGFDFLVPIEGHDLRIPLMLKGLLNPAVEGDADGRVRIECTEANTDCPRIADKYVYKTEWEWQAVISLGVSYYFAL